MSTDAIRNNPNNHVESSSNNADSSRVVNVISNGTGGAVVVDSSNLLQTSTELPKTKRTQNEVDKLIEMYIKGTELSLTEAKQMIEQLAVAKGTSLLDIDSDKLIKILTSLKYSIEDCTDKSGKLDKEKMSHVFGCYVFLSVKSDKETVDFDKIRAGMKMSFIDILKKMIKFEVLNMKTHFLWIIYLLLLMGTKEVSDWIICHV